MKQLKLKKHNDAYGLVNLPGSKSVSNRALLLSALAKGTTTITNLLKSDDTKRMLEALEKIGVKYELSNNDTKCIVHGNGGRFECVEPLELFLGNAGTAMRPLTAALAASKGTFTLTGEDRMYERPIGQLML